MGIKGDKKVKKILAFIVSFFTLALFVVSLTQPMNVNAAGGTKGTLEFTEVGGNFLAYEGGSYTLRLSSDSTSDLEVYIAYKGKFDYYPNGILEVNGNEETGDLMFEVVNNEERGIYTYVEYMTIMILTLGMEVIVLFRKKEEVNEEK